MKRKLFTTISLIAFVLLLNIATSNAAEYVLYKYDSYKISDHKVAALVIVAQADASGNLTEVTIPPAPPWMKGRVIQAEIHKGPYTGTHNGPNDSNDLIDSTANWLNDQFSRCKTPSGTTTPMTITNSTDGSSATVDDNSSYKIECNLSEGTDNNWTFGDTYVLGPTAAPTGTYNIILKANGIPIFGDGSGTDTLLGLTTLLKVLPYNDYTLFSGPITFDMTGTVGANNGIFITIYWLIK